MADPNLLELAIGYLNKSVDICQRLDAWSTRHPAPDAPLTALVHRQIKELDAQVLSLRESVTRVATLKLGRDGSAPLSDVDLARELIETRVSLLETVELVDFHNRVERCGHDGALNAAFATTYILNNTGVGNTGRSYYSEEKMRPVGLEMHGLIRDVLRASSTTNRADAFDNLRPKIFDFLTRTAEQFEPRHLHAYNAFPDTPYVIDAAGEAFSGSFGMVQKVNHRTSGESFAMKTFRVLIDKDRRNILRELGILEVCSHDNIVELVEAFSLENGRSIRLVMAPWAPYTLGRFLQESDTERRDRCPWFDPGAAESDRCVFRIMFELADAVRYLHDKKIKHKDLKPDNILLYREGSRHVTPLITDVGVSKIEFPGAGTKYTDSTYAYLAPEQCKHESSDLRSDVWQLGCCFAELFAVARGGAAAYWTLHESFNNDHPDCSCSIAGEHGSFIEALRGICLTRDIKPAVKRMYLVVMGMLALDPADRSDIWSVRGQISKLSGVQERSETS